MKSCAWCGKLTNDLITYKGDKVCKKCHSSVTSSKCRKCGELFPEENMFRGLCISCLQVEEVERAKRREEALVGIDVNTFDSGETSFTEADFERWMTYDPDHRGFTPKDFKESMFLRRLWIMTKLNAAGIVDEAVINRSMADIEELIESNFSKLINNKCRFFIFNSMSDRRKAAGMKCIAHKNKVYIMSVE